MLRIYTVSRIKVIVLCVTLLFSSFVTTSAQADENLIDLNTIDTVTEDRSYKFFQCHPKEWKAGSLQFNAGGGWKKLTIGITPRKDEIACAAYVAQGDVWLYEYKPTKFKVLKKKGSKNEPLKIKVRDSFFAGKKSFKTYKVKVFSTEESKNYDANWIPAGFEMWFGNATVGFKWDGPGVTSDGFYWTWTYVLNAQAKKGCPGGLSVEAEIRNSDKYARDQYYGTETFNFGPVSGGTLSSVRWTTQVMYDGMTYDSKLYKWIYSSSDSFVLKAISATCSK
jgi:hypothetical protein